MGANGRHGLEPDLDAAASWSASLRFISVAIRQVSFYDLHSVFGCILVGTHVATTKGCSHLGKAEKTRLFDSLSATTHTRCCQSVRTLGLLLLVGGLELPLRGLWGVGMGYTGCTYRRTFSDQQEHLADVYRHLTNYSINKALRPR